MMAGGSPDAGASDEPTDVSRRETGPHALIDAHTTGRQGVRRDLSSGVRWLGTSQIVGQVVRVAMTLVLTRLLTPAEFGIVALVMVVTGLFERVLGDTGTGAALIRQPELRHGLASTVFWWNVATGIATAALFVVLGEPIARLLGDSEATALVRVVGLAALIGGFGHVQRALLRRLRKFRSLAIVNLSNAIVTAVATIAFAVADWGEWALVIGNLVGSAASVALAWALSSWRPSFYYSRAALREITKFSANLSVQNLFGYFSYAGDRFIIGRFIGTTELGYYGLANRLLRYPLQTSAQTYREVVYPTLAKLQDDHDGLRDAYRRTLGGIAFLVVPLCLGVTALGGPMVAAVLGPQWIGATDIVRVIALVSAFQALTTTTGSLYLAKGRTDLSLRWQIVSSAVLVASYTIGAAWGAIGVAWGFLIGVVVLTYPAFRIPLKLIDAKPSQVLIPLLPTVVAAGAAATAGWAATFVVEQSTDGPWPPLIAGSLVMAAVYGAYVIVGRPTAAQDLVDSLTNRGRRGRGGAGRGSPPAA